MKGLQSGLQRPLKQALGLPFSPSRRGAAIPAGLTNAKASNTTKLRAGAAAVKAGTARSRHLFVGNSITAGLTFAEQLQSNAAAYAFPTAYAQMLDAAGYPASWQSWIGGQAEEDFPAHDNRISLAGGVNAGLGTLGSNTIKLETSGAALTFTPIGAVDTVEVLMVRGGGGVVDITNDGSASVGTWGASGGSGAVNKSGAITLNGAAGTKAIKLTRISGTSFVDGMIAYQASAKKIDVLRAGWSGSIVAWYADTWSANDGIKACLADFVGIAMTRNDPTSGTSISAYKASYQLIIDAAKANGATVLLIIEPLGSLSDATTAPFKQAIADLAASNDLPMFDMDSRWSPYASYSAYYGDAIHPVRARYQDIGAALKDAVSYMLGL